MDSFEEFEMKPLTEGLGFHKKAIRLKDKVQESKLTAEPFMAPPGGPPADEILSGKSTEPRDTLDEILNSLSQPVPSKGPGVPRKEKVAKIHGALPRREGTSPVREGRNTGGGLPDPYVPPPLPMPDGFIEEPKPSQPGVLQKPVTQRGGISDIQPSLIAAPISLSAIALDALLVVGFSMIFLISLLSATEASILSVLKNVPHDLAVQLSLGLLYLSILQMYVVIARSFFGRTLGEWTFEYQMGNDRLIKKAYYPILVVWRSLVILMTGLITLPLLSFIFRKDFAYYLTGLQLFRKKC